MPATFVIVPRFEFVAVLLGVYLHTVESSADTKTIGSLGEPRLRRAQPVVVVGPLDQRQVVPQDTAHQVEL